MLFNHKPELRWPKSKETQKWCHLLCTCHCKLLNQTLTEDFVKKLNQLIMSPTDQEKQFDSLNDINQLCIGILERFEDKSKNNKYDRCHTVWLLLKQAILRTRVKTSQSNFSYNYYLIDEHIQCKILTRPNLYFELCAFLAQVLRK